MATYLSIAIMVIVPIEAVSGVCLSILLKVHIGKPSSDSALCVSFGIKTRELQENSKSTNAKCVMSSLKAVTHFCAKNVCKVTSITQPLPSRLRRSAMM